ncbi:MAG: DUF134 domain-containing protein [Erysipelotrichaceae bacterium]
MPRPPKERRVCMTPQSRRFDPEGLIVKETVILDLDELEVIRLIDLVGLSQEAAGEQMRIGRATVQRIYEEARRKIADALIFGKSLVIGNGKRIEISEEDLVDLNETKEEKVKSIQKICIPVLDNEIHPRFGLAPQLKILSVVEGKIISATLIDTPKHKHGELPGIVSRLGVDTVIVDTLGQIGIDRFNQLNVSIYSGLKGNADQAALDVLSGRVQPNARASGHCLHMKEGRGT